MAPHVWVVEMLGMSRWEPCAEARLCRADGIRARRVWKKKNPDDRFRIAPYERASET